MNDYPANLYVSDQDAFGYWVFQNHDIIQEFRNSLPDNVSSGLDYSIESLDTIEDWIIKNFDTFSEITSFKNSSILDGCSRYVGAVFLAHLNGEWVVETDDHDDIYLNLPVIKFENGVECPLSLVSASADRRSGNYMSNLLRATIQ